MFYEEKVIDSVLMFKDSPSAAVWTPVLPACMTARLIEAEQTVKTQATMIRLLEAKRNNDRKYTEIGHACVDNTDELGHEIILMCQKKRGWTVPEFTYATDEDVRALLPESKARLKEAMEYLKDK